MIPSHSLASALVVPQWLSTVEAAATSARRDVAESLAGDELGRLGGDAPETLRTPWRRAQRELDDLSEQIRRARDSVAAALTAHQLITADVQAAANMRFQNDLARFGALVLIPGLVATVLGANVALPFQDRVLGLALLLTAVVAAGAGSYAWVKRRYLAEAKGVRRPRFDPWAVIGAAAGLASVVLIALAIATGQFGADDSKADAESRVVIRELRELSRRLSATPVPTPTVSPQRPRKAR